MEYTIQMANENMTLYYSKSTGDIKNYCSGIQDMSFFNKDEQDFSLIWDFKVFPIDQYVLDHWINFTINLDTLIIELKPQTNIYPIASQ